MFYDSVHICFKNTSKPLHLIGTLINNNFVIAVYSVDC